VYILLGFFGRVPTVNRCNPRDNKINIIITLILTSSVEMDVTFYRRSRESARREVVAEEKAAKHSHRSKLMDYVGLTLKEYFAKTD
jgi:hypothetical protein